MQDWSQSIIDLIVDISDEQALWVAYSGGVDSHVLLHCLANSPDISFDRLNAVYINHHLQAESDAWADHCEAVSHSLSVNFLSIDVQVDHVDDLGIEAAARQARYQALKTVVKDGGLVLTAQHQDDQAETLLLQLLRGAGPKGLAGMAQVSTLGEGHLARPLLAVSQAEILAYAARHQLNWVEDTSNSDTRLNRNYLRKHLWPVLTERWPSAAKTLSRSASLCEEADGLADDLARLDLIAMGCDVGASEVPISGLLALTTPRARNVLRKVIAEQNLSLPSQIVLQRVLDEVCHASEDAQPEVTWSGAVIRRYRDTLYCLPSSDLALLAVPDVVNDRTSVPLSTEYHLVWKETESQGIPLSRLASGLTLRYRQGGERIRLIGHEHHHELKQLWQTWGVPPWQRDRIPLLFWGEKLIAVVGYGLSHDCVLDIGQPGFTPVVEKVS